MTYQILLGDCIETMRGLPDACVQTCVTSPPYYGLRDYGHNGQIGLEDTPDAYVAKLVDVFREVRRVLKDDGTLWLNLGDSYASTPAGNTDATWTAKQASNAGSAARRTRSTITLGLKPKDLIGIPWAVAKALQQPYYTGHITAERDRVWLAATIDAEGTICGFTHVRKDNGETRRGVHVTITNSNTKMLDEAYRIWKTSRQEHNEHGIGHLGSLPTYRWIAHGVEEKQKLLAELYPYLICKKAQALLAWNFLEISKQARGRNKGKEGDTNREKSAWIVDALSKLNHMEHVDIPSWCIEPPSPYEQGWWLRSDIIWHKPSPMPESVTDRPTKAHEYIFLLSKSARYFYDADAVREPNADPDRTSFARGQKIDASRHDSDANTRFANMTADGRNRRSVWTVATKPYKSAHFATFPPDLIEPCILAGTSAKGCCAECGAPWERVVERNGYDDAGRADSTVYTGTAYKSPQSAPRGPKRNFGESTSTTTGWQPTCTCDAEVVPCTVLDPFSGSGTTGAVALKHGRDYIGCELNPEYIELSHDRIGKSQPMLLQVTP